MPQQTQIPQAITSPMSNQQQDYSGQNSTIHKLQQEKQIFVSNFSPTLQHKNPLYRQQDQTQLINNQTFAQTLSPSQNFSQTFTPQSQNNQEYANYDYQWFNEKIQQMRPLNSLKEKTTIEWFRKRKSQDASEMYLHSGEELSQKMHVQRVIKDLERLKKRQRHNRTSTNFNNQIDSQRFKTVDYKYINQQQIQKFQAPLKPETFQTSNTPKIQRGKNYSQPFGNIKMSKLLNLTQVNFYSQRDNKNMLLNGVDHQLNTIKAPGPTPRFKRQLSDRNNLDHNTSVKTMNKSCNQSYRQSPIKDHFKRCVEATQKSVEINQSALMSSRLIDSQVQKYQRKMIHRRIKYPVNEEEAQKCINQFVLLFKRDCKPALEESNEFYQMKKIQLKSTLAKETNPFKVSDRMKLQQQLDQSELQKQSDNQSIVQKSQRAASVNINESGPLSNKYNTPLNTTLRLNKQSNINIQNFNNNNNNRALSIEQKSTMSWQNQEKHNDQNNQQLTIQKTGNKLRDIPRDAKQLLDDMQIQLKYQRSPQEVQYLEKIEQIIRDSKNSAKSKAQSEIQSTTNIQTPI
eukprot:403336919